MYMVPRAAEKEGKQIRDSELFTRRLFHFSSAFSERTADPEKNLSRESRMISLGPTDPLIQNPKSYSELIKLL